MKPGSSDQTPPKDKDLCKYSSIFSPGKKIRAAQYITELICERKAKIDNNGQDLPNRFWKLPVWRKYFQFQIIVANRLLKKFRDDAIIRALEDKRSYKTYSLNSPIFKKLVQEYQDKGPPPAPEKPKLKVPTTQTSKTSKGVFSNKKTILDEL